MHEPISRTRTHLLLLPLLAATVAIYWLGLDGPFLFDDFHNLEVVQRWNDGAATWQEVVLGNRSGLLGRQVSMLSFLGSAALLGTEAFDFKLVNLALHVLCGLMIFAITRKATALDPRLTRGSTGLALAVTAIWLLHPLHVSTVLYVVQRMAQLSTAFALLAVLLYLVGRPRLDTEQARSGWLLLFIALPATLAAGLLSKENAAVTPLLCGVFELALFSRSPRNRLPVSLFFAVTVLLPGIAVISLLLVAPEKLLSGYDLRDFTLHERLLTQPRALMAYIGMLLLPRGPLMGLYTDDFATSTGLFEPFSTIVSLVALGVLSAAAIGLRRRAPLVFAGWFFFLAAHAVESSVLPLELYFEHRNYLPSVGLFLALVAGIAAGLQHVPMNVATPKQLGILLASVFVFAISFSTFGRVLVWQHNETIVEQGFKYHPGSLRAAADMATIATEAGRHEESIALMRELSRSRNPRNRVIGGLSAVAASCLGRMPPDLADFDLAATASLSRVTLAEAHSFTVLIVAEQKYGCAPLTKGMIADGIVRMLSSATTQPDTSGAKWQLRYLAAQTYFHLDRKDDAIEQAKLAWQPSSPAQVGDLLARLLASTGNTSDARRILGDARGRLESFDKTGISNIEATEALIEKIESLAEPALPDGPSG